MNLLVVTATGDRPFCLELLCGYLAQQTDKAFTHLVVDDGQEPSGRCGDIYIRREPSMSDPPHTLPVQLRAAMPTIRQFDAVAFAEDDEWLHPRYVERIKEMLGRGEIVGERGAKYYHPGVPGWLFWGHHEHASLCRTAVSSSLYDVLDEEVRGNESIDLRMWARCGARGHLVNGSPDTAHLTVSFKGMPGRVSSGRYHAPSACGYTPDPNYSKLRQWLGDGSSVYERISKDMAGGHQREHVA